MVPANVVVVPSVAVVVVKVETVVSAERRRVCGVYYIGISARELPIG